MRALGVVGLLALVASGGVAATPTPRAALQPFNDLIGSWRAVGEPAGTREERRKGFWQETIAWRWQFRGGDAWLRADLTGGKHFTRFELRPLSRPGQYELTVCTPQKKTLTFAGTLRDRQLTVERDEGGEKRRLVFRLLHANRHLYRYEIQRQRQTIFSPLFRVGATKEGVAFAEQGDGQPECVVSGGLGTMPIVYKGKTYYVCCSGCRDAFQDDPEKYVKEYEARRKK